MKRLFVAALSFFIFAVLSWLANDSTKVISIDEGLLAILMKTRGPALNILAQGAIAAFNLWPSVLIAMVLLVVIGLKSGLDGSVEFFILALGSLLGGTLEKLVFVRTRPHSVSWLVDASGASFPSAHSLRSIGLLLGAAVLLQDTWSPRVRNSLYSVVGLFIVWVCWAEIYAGVNYPSDVIAGIALGSAWVLGLSGLWSLKKDRA